MCLPHPLRALNIIHRTIDSFNQFSQNSGPNPSSLRCGQDIDHAQQCAIFLCGPAREQKRFAITDDNFDRLVSPKALEKFASIEPKIKDYVKHQRKRAQKLIGALKQKSDFRRWRDNHYNDLAPHIYGPYVSIKLHIDPKSQARSLKARFSPPPDAGPAFLKGMVSFADRKRDWMQQDLYHSIQSGYLDIEEARERVKREWLKLGKEWKDDFNTDNRSLLVMLALRIRALKSPMRTPLCPTPECQKGVQTFFVGERFKKMLEQLESKINHPDYEKHILSSCKSSIGLYSEKRYNGDSVKRMIARAGNNVLEKVVQKHFSAPSHQYFKEYLDRGIQFTLRGNEEQSEKLNLVYNTIDRQHKKLSAASPELKESDLPSLIATMMKKYREGKNLNPYLTNPCGTFHKLPKTDRFFAPRAGFSGWWEFADPFERDRIDVSPMSCAFPHHGEATMAHEFAHALSYASMRGKLSDSSQQRYLRLRECATSAHKNKKPFLEIALKHPRDGQYTEEDVADIIGWSTYSDSLEIGNCYGLKTNPNFSKYISLNIRDHFILDTHSSDFLRVIMEAVYKNIPLPSSCQKVLDDHKHIYEVKKCTLD